MGDLLVQGEDGLRSVPDLLLLGFVAGRAESGEMESRVGS
jgi:hypothetical protein